VTPERKASDEELFGREFEVSVFLGNENTRGVIPLKELRLRFCEEPIDAAELGSATSRALEVVTDPWFISMDGKQEVRVTHGAWSLIPMESPADGTHFLRVYVDLPDGVSKSDVGLNPGRRLFFATTLWQTAALPRLLENRNRLEAVIEGYNESVQTREGTNWLQRFRSSVAGYNKYREASIVLEKISGIGSPGKSEGVVLGAFTASKEGYVGVQGGRRGRQFGQVGTFSIRRAREIPVGTATAQDRELVR
jgi:hypothetical protein